MRAIPVTFYINIISDKCKKLPKLPQMVVLEKKFKEFCQFRLNLLIKIYYIPDLKKNLSWGSKVMANFFLFFCLPYLILIPNQ